jgi:hypothetical protein
MRVRRNRDILTACLLRGILPLNRMAARNWPVATMNRFYQILLYGP